MIGQPIAHYTITEKIGQGGMGEVYPIPSPFLLNGGSMLRQLVKRERGVYLRSFNEA